MEEFFLQDQFHYKIKRNVLLIDRLIGNNPAFLNGLNEDWDYVKPTQARKQRESIWLFRRSREKVPMPNLK